MTSSPLFAVSSSSLGTITSLHIDSERTHGDTAVLQAENCILTGNLIVRGNFVVTGDLKIEGSFEGIAILEHEKCYFYTLRDQAALESKTLSELLTCDNPRYRFLGRLMQKVSSSIDGNHISQTKAPNE